LKEFKALNADELYKGLSEITWEDLLDENGYFSVTSNVDNPTIDNSMFPSVKTKDAIVDRIRDKKGYRPNTGPDRHKAVIHLFWLGSTASVYIDSSGETLSKHGYRKHPGLAPMQENLAASVVLATGWDGKGSFINPMCGSGTLAIEAALLALNRGPGLYRDNYSFMHIKGYDSSVYEEERKRSRESALKKIEGQIIATDIDQRAVDMAYKNAVTAGVEHMIHFEVCDFRETPVPKTEGVVVFNPEYGERLGEYEELELIYKAIGDFMKKECKGYKGYVFTGSPDLAKKIGLKASRKIEFYNSKLDCRLLEYELYVGSKGRREKPAPQPNEGTTPGTEE
jgi:putative N6-adenine-specific DNA methylase